ncbi:hypothetical protein P3S68_019139 [Capsicum galapagoense]
MLQVDGDAVDGATRGAAGIAVGGSVRDAAKGSFGGSVGVAADGAAGAVESGDWQIQLLPSSRQRVVNKIMETIEKHLVSGKEREEELKKIVVMFEEEIYTAVTSQVDYLRKISSWTGQNALGPGEQRNLMCCILCKLAWTVVLLL